jgi:hypothetical protein
MKFIRPRLCYPCIVIGLIMFVYSIESAFAQAQVQAAGPTFDVWFQLLSSVVIMLLGAFAAGLRTSIKDVDTDSKGRDEKIIKSLEGIESDFDMRCDQNHDELVRLRETVLTKYHDKEELREHLTELKNAVVAVHRRLDAWSVPKSGSPPNT